MKKYALQRCPICGELTTAGKYCFECGGETERTIGVAFKLIVCPNCGTEVPKKNFCTACGTKFNEE